MSRTRSTARPATFLLLAALWGCSGSSSDTPVRGNASTGPAGLAETSVAEGPFDAPPLALVLSPGEAPLPHVAWPARRWRTGTQAAEPAAATPDTVLLGAPTPRTPLPFTSFEGIGQGVAGYTVFSAPPDSTGAVGPNHYVEAVNSAVAVYDKTTGELLMGPADIQTLFVGTGTGCASTNDGDPQVLYDQLADRWVVSQFSVASSPTTFWECVAVSRTGDPTGAWWTYAFSYSFFPDYPKLSLWPDAYYVTYVKFMGSSYLGHQVCALDRAAMLQGRTAAQQCFDVDRSYAPALVASLDGSDLPPTGSPAYVLSDAASPPYDHLLLWKLHVDWAVPAASTFTGPTPFATQPYSITCSGTGGACAAQPNTSQRIDTLGDRLMARAAYRNLGDHEALAANRTVLANGASGVRWWEIRGLATSPVVYQEGTVSPDAAYRFMGSIAMDRVGNLAVGYSLSSATLYPAIAVSGRLSTDPAGTMPIGEEVIQAGFGSQTGLERWGDYTSMTVDPVDGCTFYYVNQYLPASGSFNWRTRVAYFSFPSCPATPRFTISGAPPSLTVTQGASGASTISTTQVNGAGTVNLAAAVVPAGSGVTASLDTASVPAGGSAVLTVTAAASAAVGSYAVTVTGTEGAFTRSTTVTVTVPAPDFTISGSPATLTVNRGTSGASTVSTTQVNSAGTVSLATLVVPPGSGVTALLDAASIAAGGSAVLTVSAAASAAPGNYTVVVDGTEGANAHAAMVAVTVPAPDFAISTSPATLRVVQGGTGTATATTTPVNSADAVSLAVAVAPPGSGVTASLDTSSVVAGGSAVVSVSASASAVPGGYTVTVEGTEGAFAHAATIAVTVPAPDFTISSAPTSLAVIQGGTGTSAISTTQLVSPGTVGLSASVSPADAGVTATLDGSSVPAGGAVVLTVAASGSAAPGSYAVSVVGTEGPFTHGTTLDVTVPVPDFAIAASPGTLSVSQGSTGTSTVTTTAVNGAGAVTLSAAVTPSGAGVTASLDRGSVTSGGIVILSVTATASATPGTYAVAVSGTENAFAHSAAVAVTVQVPAPGGGGGCSTTGNNAGSVLPLLGVLLVGGLRRRRDPGPGRASRAG